MTPLPLQHGALFFDNSFLESFQGCDRQTLYKQLRRRHLAAARPALNFGTAIHRALDLRYSRFGSDLPSNPLDLSSYKDDRASMLLEYFSKNPNPEDDFRNVNWAVEVLQQYDERYNLEPFTLVLRDGKPVVEQAFAIPFALYNRLSHILLPWEQSWVLEALTDEEHIPIIFTGRIDLPVEWSGDRFIMDHKTTSILGESFWDQYRMSAQPVGYCWAWHKATGEMPKGFAINAIRVRPLPGKPVGGPSKWWEESFQRNREYIFDRHLVEWHSNTLSQLDQFFYNVRKDVWPMKRLWCVGKFGKCQFYDVCISAPEDREVLLGSDNYLDYEWSPLD